MALAGCVPPWVSPHPGPKPSKVTSVQLLAINDFHGNLEPPTGSGGRIQTGVDATGKAITVDAGGVSYLAQHLKELRRGHKNTLTVAAGDMIGASPLTSALFHDEPTIEALNALQLDVSSVGNHEFDEGITELKRIQNGGCHPTDGCQTGHPYQGADFPYLAANVVSRKTGKPVLPPYAIKQVGGVKVGFIGETLKGTPAIVSAAGIKGLEFTDEAATANRYVKELQAKGRAVDRPAAAPGRGPVHRCVRRQRLHRPVRRSAPHPRQAVARRGRRSLRPHPPGVQPASSRTAPAIPGSSPAAPRSAGSSPTST